MNDHDFDTLMRAAVSDHARALVPDSTTRPRLADLSDRPAPARRPARRRPRGPRVTGPRGHGPRIWLASGLAAATAAVVVLAVLAVGSQARADRRSPLPPGTVSVSPDATAVSPSTPLPTSRDETPGTGFNRSPVVAPGDGETSVSTATTANPSNSSEVAVYANCNDPANDPPAVRPTAIGLACADNGENLLDLTWSAWSATGATGTGTLEYRTCDPDCATGSQIHQQSGVTVTLSAPGAGVDGRTVWTRLELSSDPVGDGTYSLYRQP